jgi:hypothetical protein
MFKTIWKLLIQCFFYCFVLCFSLNLKIKTYFVLFKHPPNVFKFIVGFNILIKITPCVDPLDAHVLNFDF